jgi:type II secretory pathway pseudopilin PulG
MIVIAIIAIIAAIAIPNLLESRITANEAAAASSLKSGLFPGQVAYQSGAYIDVDANGRGIFAGHTRSMSGTTGTGTTLVVSPSKALSMLDPKFNNTLGQVGPTTIDGVATVARVGAFDYALCVDTASETMAEQYWGAIAVPITTDGNNGRRGFGINSTGTIYQTKQTLANSNLTIASLQHSLAGVAGATPLFATACISTNPSVNSTNGSPYQK